MMFSMCDRTDELKMFWHFAVEPLAILVLPALSISKQLNVLLLVLVKSMNDVKWLRVNFIEFFFLFHCNFFIFFLLRYSINVRARRIKSIALFVNVQLYAEKMKHVATLEPRWVQVFYPRLKHNRRVTEREMWKERERETDKKKTKRYKTLAKCQK